MLAQPKLTKELKIFLRGFPVAEKRPARVMIYLSPFPNPPPVINRHTQVTPP